MKDQAVLFMPKAPPVVEVLRVIETLENKQYSRKLSARIEEVTLKYMQHFVSIAH